MAKETEKVKQDDTVDHLTDIKSLITGLTEAIKELTTAQADMTKAHKALEEEWKKWRKAGKF